MNTRQGFVGVADTQEAHDPDTGISVRVAFDMRLGCVAYRFSTDTESVPVPDHLFEEYWGPSTKRTNRTNGLAVALLLNYENFRPYEASKFALMQ